jgi:hypothetical protein
MHLNPSVPSGLELGGVLDLCPDEGSRVAGRMQRGGIAASRSRVAVVLVVFALLAFTTIHTSPLSTGITPGSSLSKTTPKQRDLSVQEIVWTFPVLGFLEQMPLENGPVPPTKPDAFYFDHFSGRYFSLPPPLA